MDIKLTYSLIKDYLDTSASPEELAKAISLCGPTVDRMHQKEDETIFDIEIITNRIDSASAFGVAREAGAILPQFNHQATLKNNPYKLTVNDLGPLPNTPPVKVQILDHSLVPRFACIAMKVKVKDSPKDCQELLTNLDQRPINNLVDITNELTARYGQPTHVFDLDKIKGNLMKLRASKKGEKITTLDYKIHTLKGDDIVIEDGEGNLIDLCGVMGGALSAVDENTTKILFFVQKYEPKHIRKTSLSTQERTIASQIFEKDPDPELVLPTLVAGVKLFQERADAEILSNLVDIYPSPIHEKNIELDLNWLNKFVGIEISPETVTEILKNLGFASTGKKVITCTIPSWRVNDINTKEDLAEEVSRVYGYFRLPSIIPPTTASSIPTADILNHELIARKYLSDLGFTEIYNYSLVSKSLFQQAALSLENAIKTINPLSSDYEYMRTSLIPSLLYDLDKNRGKVKPPVRIFELSNIYLPTEGQQLPSEVSSLAIATQGLDFLETKGYLEALAKHLHVSLKFKAAVKTASPFIASQLAEIMVNNTVIGHIGSIDSQVLTNFQLTEEKVMIAQLNFEQLSKAIDPIHHFKKVSEFPSVFEDITIESNRSIQDILETLGNADPSINQVTYISSYQNKHTFRLEFVSYTDNLTQEQVTQIKNLVVSKI